MTYAECFKQAMSGQAYVRCTYAEVCNTDGTPIFVFQKERFDGAVVSASFDATALKPTSKIQATLTDDAAAVLTEYYNTYILNRTKREPRHQHTSNGKYLADYFDGNGQLLSKEVTINPYRYAWSPVSSKKNNTSNIALLVAAGSALLD